MRFSTIVAGLLVEIAGTTALTLPFGLSKLLEAESECVNPASYTVSDFTIFTTNSTSNTTSFHFTDSDSGIDTNCQHNASSVSVTPSPGATPRWPCDNTAVEFIYQYNGLTVIEAVCPSSSSTTKFEAAGLAQFNLTCTSSTGGKICSAPALVTGNFTSFEPRPSASSE